MEGEALVVRPDGYLTIRAASPDPASVSLFTLTPADPAGLGDTNHTGEAFASPGGSHDIELVGDILAEGESAAIPAAASPIFVLVTEGSLAIALDEDETRIVQAGDAVLVPGELVVTGAAEEQTRFAAAVIGAGVVATSADLDGETTSPPPSPTPRPSPLPSASPKPSASPSPTPSPSPSSSPSPTPDGEGPNDDPDNDGLVNEREDALKTDRHDPDTDFDLLTDGEEYHMYLSNPTVKDTDLDDLYDGDEVIRVRTSPISSDSDGDSLGDGAETNELFTNPLDDDTDHDDLKDPDEFVHGTDSRVVDTDGDSVAEGVEVSQYFTKPLVYESDGDGYSDGAEIYEHRTWPLDPESHP